MCALATPERLDLMDLERVICAFLVPTNQIQDPLRVQGVGQESSLQWLVLLRMCALATLEQLDLTALKRVLCVTLENTRQMWDLLCAQGVGRESSLQ